MRPSCTKFHEASGWFFHKTTCIQSDRMTLVQEFIQEFFRFDVLSNKEWLSDVSSWFAIGWQVWAHNHEKDHDQWCKEGYTHIFNKSISWAVDFDTAPLSVPKDFWEVIPLHHCLHTFFNLDHPAIRNTSTMITYDLHAYAPILSLHLNASFETNFQSDFCNLGQVSAKLPNWSTTRFAKLNRSFVSVLSP